MTAQRNTKQRQLVLDAVCSRTDHPTADQVYLDVRKKNPRVSRGTVYRNLAVLEGNGEILQVKTPTASRYDLTVRPHYHVMCTVCGNVCDAPFAYQSQIDERVQELTGFAITGHATLFEGVCPACQEEIRRTSDGQAVTGQAAAAQAAAAQAADTQAAAQAAPGSEPSPICAHESDKTEGDGAGDTPLPAGDGGL